MPIVKRQISGRAPSRFMNEKVFHRPQTSINYNSKLHFRNFAKISEFLNATHIDSTVTYQYCKREARLYMQT